MAWSNEKIVVVFLAATVIAVLFAPLSGVITAGTGDQTVDNESITASTSEYVQLDGYDVADGSVTVEWYNSTSDSYETVAEGTDYEIAYDSGAIRANSSGQIGDGDDLRVSYTYAATDGTTGRVAELVPLFLALLMLVAFARPIIKEGWG